MYQFLKDYTGIIMTERYGHFGVGETPVSSNRSKHSQFDLAIEKVCSNPEKINKYMTTISSGIDVLCNAGNLIKNQKK
jgi:hypothetical protein